MQNSGATPAVVAASDLHKSFGDRLVLRGFHFTADRGSRHVICGPNGSGKTTLVRIITTLVVPDQGRLSICGHPVPNELADVRRHVSAYLFSNRGLWPQLSVLENLRLHARLFGTPDAHVQQRLRELEPLLSPLLGLKPHELSLGMRQLALIGRALLRNVSLYVLDEPFAVLDDKNSAKLVAVLDAIANSGGTVLLTAQSHSLDRLPKSYIRMEMGGAE